MTRILIFFKFKVECEHFYQPSKTPIQSILFHPNPHTHLTPRLPVEYAETSMTPAITGLQDQLSCQLKDTTCRLYPNLEKNKKESFTIHPQHIQPQKHNNLETPIQDQTIQYQYIHRHCCSQSSAKEIRRLDGQLKMKIKQIQVEVNRVKTTYLVVVAYIKGQSLI